MMKMVRAASTTPMAQFHRTTMVASSEELPVVVWVSRGVWVRILSELWSILSMRGWSADKMAWAIHCAIALAASCAQHVGSNGLSELQGADGPWDAVGSAPIPPAPDSGG